MPADGAIKVDNGRKPETDPPHAEPPAAQGSERRQAMRLETNTICSLTVGQSADSTSYSAMLLDISLTGAGIECPEPLPLGTEVKLNFAESGQAQMPAKVIRQIGSEPGSYRFGLSMHQTWPPDVFYSLAFPDQLLTAREMEVAAANVPEGWVPLEGYQFVRPIARGGSGNVYEVRAPGGFSKAIKRIALNPNSPLSLREILGFRLIRSIRHPYLLSVDRLTIRQNNLLVVMELADHSVFDEYKRDRERGLPGIPRVRLMSLMREAADVLDALAVRHGLQHLDIKPENMFLIADHLKLGDFGLVRHIDGEVLDIRNNAVTAAYAAPEMLDGRCTPTSDQFSLAIVFMEMLAGKRPYQGTDVRTVVLQHIKGPPDLSTLPESDRPVIAKALARDPAQRWASCSEFIEALGIATPTPHSSMTGPIGQWQSAPLSTGVPLPNTGNLVAKLPSGGVDTVNSLGMKLALVAEGEFDQGASDADPDARPDERPRHRVRIKAPFWISMHAVTQEQYRSAMGENPSCFCATGRYAAFVQNVDSAQFPVDNVTFYMAIEYCNRLSELEWLRPYYTIVGQRVRILGGDGYRLPTEAEWEYACRAGTTTRWHFGNDPAAAEDYVVYSRGKAARPSPVGTKKPNALGLFDMHGNVHEWCFDRYGETFYEIANADNPIGADKGGRRVLRGGSFYDPLARTRSSARHNGRAWDRGGNVGFRVVRSAV